MLLAQVARKLGGRGRLARALKAGHQDHRGRSWREAQACRGSSHQARQLVGDDLDDLLARVELADDVSPKAALLHIACEALDDLEVDVGLQQRKADLAHRPVDVGFRSACRAGARRPAWPAASRLGSRTSDASILAAEHAGAVRAHPHRRPERTGGHARSFNRALGCLRMAAAVQSGARSPRRCRRTPRRTPRGSRTPCWSRLRRARAASAGIRS